MKITNKQLKQIIKEELNKVIKESWFSDTYGIPKNHPKARMYNTYEESGEEEKMNSLWQIVQFIAKRDGAKLFNAYARPGQERDHGDGRVTFPLIDYVEKAKKMVPDLFDIDYWDFLKFISKRYIEVEDESGSILNWP